MSEMHIANMDEARRLILEATAREDALREDVARLQREVGHRLAEMNLQARWTREAQEKTERLRAALRPFADTADRNPAAHDAANVTVRMRDCRAAEKALRAP